MKNKLTRKELLADIEGTKEIIKMIDKRILKLLMENKKKL